MKNNIKLKDTIEMICEKWGGDQLEGFISDPTDRDATALYTTREGLEKQAEMIEENFKLLNTDVSDLTSDEQSIFGNLSEWIHEKMDSGKYPGTQLMAVLPREDGDFSMETFEIN